MEGVRGRGGGGLAVSVSARVWAAGARRRGRQRWTEIKYASLDKSQYHRRAPYQRREMSYCAIFERNLGEAIPSSSVSLCENASRLFRSQKRTDIGMVAASNAWFDGYSFIFFFFSFFPFSSLFPFRGKRMCIYIYIYRISGERTRIDRSPRIFLWSGLS